MGGAARPPRKTPARPRGGGTPLPPPRGGEKKREAPAGVSAGRGESAATGLAPSALLNSLFKVLFNFPLRYLLAIGLVPVFSLRWSLPPALGCIPKQPDSGKTRARRAGGRYRPHTVHGLGLDQKDLGPPRAAPGSGSSVRHISRAPPRGGDSALGSSLFTRRY